MICKPAISTNCTQASLLLALSSLAHQCWWRPPAPSHLGMGRREVAYAGVLIYENQKAFPGLSEHTGHLELFPPVVYSPREICVRGGDGGGTTAAPPQAVTQQTCCVVIQGGLWCCQLPLGV